MSKTFSRSFGLVSFTSLLAGWILIASTMSARAANLTPDPDFGAQTNGSPIGAPWGPVSGGLNSAQASAQSPFTNVLAANGVGANTPATAANPYIVGGFGPAIPAAATGQLYLNAEFRNNSAHTGDYSLVVTNAANGNLRSSALYVTGGVLYADANGGAGTPILSLRPNTWYSAQLTLDMTSNTYSGAVTQFGGNTTLIPSRAFVTENPIDNIYSDGGTSIVGGDAPDHDLDNFVLSNTPLAAPSIIATREHVVNIDFNGFRDGDVVGPTYQGSGAAGGGTVFNGLQADSTGNTNIPGDPADNLVVSGTNLLDSLGNTTSINFTVSPVGGDVGGPATTDPTSSQALFSDYVFDNSAGNVSSSPFTISGLSPNTTSADLYFYTSQNPASITVDGAALATYVGYGIFDNNNTRFFADVPVVNGMITGQFGNGFTAVVNGLSIVTYAAPVPEPGSIVLVLLGGLGFACAFRRRSARSAKHDGQ